VWALTPDAQVAEGLRQQASRLDELDRPQVLVGEIADLPELLHALGQETLRFDAILARNMWTQATAGERSRIARVLASILAPGGRVSVAQTVPRHTQRIYRLVDLDALPGDLAQRIAAAEEAIYGRADDPWVNWDAADLEEAFREAGYASVRVDVAAQQLDMLVTPALLERWFAIEGDGERPTYAQHLLSLLQLDELARYRGLLERTWLNQPAPWQLHTAFIVAEHIKHQQ
jgi:putative ATPase